VLASVDRSRLTAAELLTLVAAQAQQVAHDQAQLLASMWEAGYAGYPDDSGCVSRRERLDEFSADELAFTLRWSRTAVAVQLDLAKDLIERLPAVYAALLAGRIDLVKARAFAEAVALLDDDTARQVVAGLLGQAERLTVGQLRDRLRYRVLKADPALARRRYRRSVADRRVCGQIDGDGTATLSGISLPPDRAYAAADRLARLARAAKADGDVRSLAQLEADALLALVTGVPFTLRPPADPLTDDADAEARGSDWPLDGGRVSGGFTRPRGDGQPDKPVTGSAGGQNMPAGGRRAGAGPGSAIMDSRAHACRRRRPGGHRRQPPDRHRSAGHRLNRDRHSQRQRERYGRG